MQYPHTIHGPNDSLVQPPHTQGRKKSNSIPTVSPQYPQVGQEMNRRHSAPIVPLDKIKEYDTISQSSSVKSSDSEGKERRKKRRSKKRTAKVQPKEQIDGVQDGANKWANTPPGPPVTANAQIPPVTSSPTKNTSQQNSNNNEDEPIKERPRLKKCSVSMDHLLYMNEMLAMNDTEINPHSEKSSLHSLSIHGPNVPDVGEEECTQPVSATNGVGTSEVPGRETVSPVAHSSDSPNDVPSHHSRVESQNKSPLANGAPMSNVPTDDTKGAPIGNIPTHDTNGAPISNIPTCDTNGTPIGSNIPTRNTNLVASKSARVKAKMSVSVDHFLYMDNSTNSPESNLKTQAILSSISDDEPKEDANIPPNSDEAVPNPTSAITPKKPDTDTKSPNCADRAPNLGVINEAEDEIDHSDTADSRQVNPFTTGATFIPTDSSSQILMANFTTKSSISVEFEQTNSADLPPNSAPKTPAVTLPSEESSDEANDDRQVLIGYREKKRRPKRMDMSVEDFLKSLDKL